MSMLSTEDKSKAREMDNGPESRSFPEENEGDTALPWRHEGPLPCPREWEGTQPCPGDLKEADTPHWEGGRGQKEGLRGRVLGN